MGDETKGRTWRLENGRRARFPVYYSEARSLPRPAGRKRLVVVVQYHGIYPDSRSKCYQIADFDGEFLVRTNSLEAAFAELAQKHGLERAVPPSPSG
jgi:hypothetical protein